MARDISTINQTNLWGKQADEGLGLEPQRNDLYFVDFASAQKNVAAAANIQLAPIFPQYVRSITLPELRTKADPIRRDSNSYNTPSWDDPLDPIKIVFMMDTKNQDDSSDVMRFLDAWLALTRAGRGGRSQGYTPSEGWLLLNSDYRVDFQFNVNLFLLRGFAMTFGGFFDDQSNRTDDQFKRVMALANIQYRNEKRRVAAMQTGSAGFSSIYEEKSFETAQGVAGGLAEAEGGGVATNYVGGAVEQDMVIHTVYVLKKAWLGAYKISDLNYTESSIVTVEATFYADAVEQSTTLPITGAAQKVDQNQ